MKSRMSVAAFVLASIALFVALSGGAVAAGIVPLARHAVTAGTASNAVKFGGKTPAQLRAAWLGNSSKQGVPGPDIGGALTPWHYHTNVCFSVPGLLISGLSTPFGECPPGSVRITTADQLHVWTAPNPNGPFGDLDEAWVRKLDAS